MHEWLKAAFLIPFHLVVAPTAGLLIRSSRKWQQVVFFLLMFFTVYDYTRISMSPWFPDPLYRGHTRGYECTILEVLAIVLIFANVGVPGRIRGPWFPPGLFLWLAYCFAGLLSIVNSENASYTMMAFVKFTKAALVFIGAFHFFREEKDIRFWLRSVAVILIFQGFVCVVQKYYYHIHQVTGWFEHQNAMVMYTYLLALPLLSAAMSSHISQRDTITTVAGFVFGGISAVMALSRVGLLAFTAGAIIVVVLGLMERMSTKRLALIGSMGLLALLGGLLVADSVIGRFRDSGNVQSEMTRELLNKSSREMLHDHLILGIGWNNYGIVINPPYHYGDTLDEYARSIGRRRYVDSEFGKPISESWYYLILAETGWLGMTTCLVFILTLLFWTGRAAWRFRHTLPGSVAAGIFVGTGLNYLQSGFERVLTQPKNIAAWMICLGLVSRLEWRRRQARRAAALPPRSSNPVSRKSGML